MPCMCSAIALKGRSRGLRRTSGSALQRRRRAERRYRKRDPGCVRLRGARGRPAPRVLRRPVGQTLVEKAEHAALLVIGTREHTGVDRVLNGWVSHYCLTRVQCPLVAVPPALSLARNDGPGRHPRVRQCPLRSFGPRPRGPLPANGSRSPVVSPRTVPERLICARHGLKTTQ